MKDRDTIKQRIVDSIQVKQNLLGNESLIDVISVVIDEVVTCIRNGGKLVVCGNGGSASDALHFAGEMVGRFIKERKAWPVLVLNADVATLTAIANDYGYDDVFARQIEGHLKPEDLFIGISTSGNSENVYRAVLKAKEIGAKTVCLLGKDGGKIGKLADLPIIIPCNVTARVQECHICIIHILCEISEVKLVDLKAHEKSCISRP
ncbi:D-sedoheptulose-7-phosphate isomerase [Phocaeicola sp.]